MQASLLIDPLLPSLKPTDSIDKALEWMTEYSLPQLAVSDNNHYVGMVTEDGLHSFDMSALTIAEVPLEYKDLYVSEDQHIFEAIKLLNNFDLSIIAILDESRHFAGVATAQHLYRIFGEQFGANDKGAIVELKIDQRDYSLSEVCRLIESNNVKVISSYYHSPQQGDVIRESYLTLKLNQSDIAAPLATLERFGYNITGVYAHSPIENIDQERLDSLLRYLAT